MVEPSLVDPNDLEYDQRPEKDLTGRRRMARNVMVSWAGDVVFIVAGFIMPRMIDRKLGQETLGIWDFSWSTLAYFGLVQMGIGSSVNRYVAQYRARGEIDLVSGIVSSVMFLQCLMGLVVLGLTGLLTYLLPSFWGPRLGGGIGDAQVVLLTLGSSLAIQIALASFTGVITGCHRWDVHNYIKSAWHMVTIGVMIVLLQLGLGVRSLAVASLVGLGLADLNRIVCAFSLCPGMCVNLRFVRLSMMRDAFGFGIKMVAPRIGDLLLNQTSSILVAGFLGPSALALYSRPKSLVQYTGVLVSKLAFVLTPTASALHSTSRGEELRALFINATRYAACISLPLTIGMVIMGGPLLQLWMGPKYANGTLVALVALGSFAMFTFMPAMSILAGLNAHGRPGMMHLLAAACSVVLVFLALGPLHMGLEGVALAVGLPLTVAYGVYVSVYACRRLETPWASFLSGAFRIPLLCTIPLAICLIASRLLLHDQPLRSLWLGTSIGGILLAVTYWRYVLPERIRRRLSHLPSMEKLGTWIGQ
jgi:O-antigen/teichoic acid export membrane protein